jgi:hypothetical protein
MQVLTQLANSGRFTGRPADVNGRDGIGVRLVLTGAAPKLILELAVFLGAVATLGIGATGIPRIDRHHRDAREGSLVGQEKTELAERPGIENSSLRTPGRCPFTHPRQFIHATPKRVYAS